jgi:release factor glutamine methyltransferase
VNSINNCFKNANERLISAGIDSAAFDAACIYEKHTGKKPYEIIDLDTLTEKKIMIDIEKRSTHYPLQYILGEWEFMGLPFFVGEGVLIPRQDTEILCETAIDLLKSRKSLKVLDLCSGSGCIAITIAKFIPQAEVFALEYSQTATEYIKKNASLNDIEHRLSIMNGNAFLPPESNIIYDAILSNPPYIPTEEIKTLQSEVGFEPILALDGGIDGLDFYRAICELWLPFLKNGGLLAVEIGQSQEKDVVDLFTKYQLKNIRVKKDYAGINRVVFGENLLK